MIEKIREEFRKHILSEGWEDMHLKQNSAGDYDCLAVDRRWCGFLAGWLASRESLVIELPKVEGIHCDAQKYMRNGCKYAIEAAGLKVKP